MTSSRTDQVATALPWLAWTVLVHLRIDTVEGWVVPVGAVLMLGACWVVVPAARRPLARPVISAVTTVCAVWAVLGIVLHRPGAGGPVVWTLPSWTPTPGGALGGAVTTGQLWDAVEQAARASVTVAAVGLLYAVVPAGQWHRFAEFVAGPGAPALAPLAGLGDTWLRDRTERRALQHHGLDAVDRRARLAGFSALWTRAVEDARTRDVLRHATCVDRATDAHGAVRTSVRLLAAAGLSAAVVVGAISTTSIAAPVLLAGGAAAWVVLCLLFAPGALPRPGAADLAPAVGLVSLLVASTQSDLASVAALAVVPLLLLASRGRA